MIIEDTYSNELKQLRKKQVFKFLFLYSFYW